MKIQTGAVAIAGEVRALVQKLLADGVERLYLHGHRRGAAPDAAGDRAGAAPLHAFRSARSFRPRS